MGLRGRRSGRACTRWRLTSRPSRRCLMSGCRAPYPTCLAWASARAGW